MQSDLLDCVDVCDENGSYHRVDCLLAGRTLEHCLWCLQDIRLQKLSSVHDFEDMVSMHAMHGS